MRRRKTPDAASAVIGLRIRSLREEKGVTLEALAFRSDQSKGHLSSIEHGFVMPTVATLKGLADQLEVLVGDLVVDLDGSDREKIIALSRGLPKGHFGSSFES